MATGIHGDNYPQPTPIHAFYQISISPGRLSITDIYQISDRLCSTSDKLYDMERYQLWMGVG